MNMKTTQTTEKTSKRDERRKKRQQEQRKSQLWWGGGIILVVGLLGLLLWYTNRPLLGEEFPVTGENDHLELSEPPPLYSTDPPTSGRHYPTWWQAGFYDETSPEVTNFPFPAGYLVHNLEHGYVIFWYNCTLVTPEECATLKSELRTLIEEANNFKVIAFPWTTTDVPVVVTSWGRMLKMETFDPELAAEMIQRNRNHAPEPNAE
jgi:hypothetical protein